MQLNNNHSVLQDVDDSMLEELDWGDVEELRETLETLQDRVVPIGDSSLVLAFGFEEVAILSAALTHLIASHKNKQQPVAKHCRNKK
ncbi:hypothetical protein [Symmachiella dynata]|uniref:hypothetical protein n=1 Tax=Symmachiella dynata TaxID=2527995 RepID=UPI0030EB91D0